MIPVGGFLVKIGHRSYFTPGVMHVVKDEASLMLNESFAEVSRSLKPSCTLLGQDQ